MSNDHDDSELLIDLFNEWSIPDNITRNFIENDITLQMLKKLSESLLRELCPHIATRIKLIEKIKAFVPTNQNDEGLGDGGNSGDGGDGGDGGDSGDGDHQNESDREDPEANNEFDDEIDYFRSLNLIDLLTIAPEGKNILKDYEENSKLKSTNQQLLVDIIGRFLYPWLENNNMNDRHYRCLLKKIKNLFPNECISVYFIKPVPKRLSPTNKPISMRGKLPDKIRNLKFTSGISRGKKRKNNAVDISIEEKRQRYNELLDKHVNDIIWLKEHNNPWPTVEAKWNSTFEIRKCSTHKSVREFIDKWPILDNLRGKNLITLDFESMYPGKSDILQNDWRPFFDRIKTLRSTKYAEDKTILSYKKMIAAMGDGEETINLKFVIELSMLAYLIPSEGRNSRKIKHGRKEASETIVLFVENPGDIDTEMESQRQRALQKNDTVQPYVLIQGSRLEHDQVFLVIDTIKYQFNSAIKAFDCLFKCFHVFQANYPKDSTHIHLLIQRCLFKIKTTYDHVLPTSIIDIVEVIERI